VIRFAWLILYTLKMKRLIFKGMLIVSDKEKANKTEMIVA